MRLPRLFIHGDSISIHYRPYLEQALAGVMQCSWKREDLDVPDLDIPTGANAGDSDRCLRYVRWLVEAGSLEADYFLLNCGLHDIKVDPQVGATQVPLERYRQNLLGIVDLLKSTGVRLVWMRTTPVDDAIHNTRCTKFHRFAADCDRYNAAADAIMAEHGITRLDLHGFTRALGPDLFCDHVHFHDAIRRQQAAYLAGWLACAVTATAPSLPAQPSPAGR